jgi:hypothetical protein
MKQQSPMNRLVLRSKRDGGIRMCPSMQPNEPMTASPGSLNPEPGVLRSRTRSFCFLEREGVRWTAFLVTYQRVDGVWRGYFGFRSASSGSEGVVEVRTADLFVEPAEEEVDARARGLGRPLVLALLESALETEERRRGFSPDVQRWFRDMLRRHSLERARSGVTGTPATTSQKGAPSLSHLRSLYESYRADQVAHLIALLKPDDFRELVEIRLEGRRIDFHSRDRFQLAMIVVQDLEKRLPLPPFEVWVEDYLAHPEEYRRYSHALHRAAELP